jgi:5-methylcytosine-specific restriction endonuclease McrA
MDRRRPHTCSTAGDDVGRLAASERAVPWRPSDRGDPRLYDHRYRKARKATLERANYQCEIRIPDVCIGRATETDHVAGARNDPQHRHLRAACRPCHLHVTARQGGGYRGATSDPPPRPSTTW